MDHSNTLISNDIDTAAQLLTAGQLVAIPTETVYGLAANIFDEQAVNQIFELKQRPLFNPLIVHIHEKDQLLSLCEHVPEKAKVLIDQFWPGPLTLVLPKTALVPDIITANKPTVAIRMPQHPLLRSLLSQLDFPIAAPSANPFKRISPTNAQRVKNYFDGRLPMVLDGGECEKGIESTIIGFEGESAILYRLGSLPLESIESAIGPIHQQTRNDKTPQAPGMLLKHYSPIKPLILSEHLSEDLLRHKDKKKAILVYDEFPQDLKAEYSMTFHGNLLDAAKGLYEALQTLDASQAEIILVERFPNHGLGASINDRLERAAL